MSGGGSTNSVSQQTVPDWLKPYLTTSLSQGLTDLQNPPQYYGGAQVAPLSGLQTQGLNDIAGIAQLPNASNSAQAANQFMTSGALLNPNANPYLQGQFNLGANQIQNQLSSEFAGAGSNVLNSLPIQQQGMSDLASNLYGNAYGQGLTAMNQASALAPSIDQGTYLPSQALLSAGGTQQNQAQNQINAAMQKWNFQQQEPENLLSWYAGLENGSASPFIGNSTTGTQSANQTAQNVGLGLAAAGTSAYLMPILAGLFGA